MVTAKEARERVNKLTEQEQKDVEAEINKAIEKGKLYCIFESEMSYATVEWLKSLGYGVEKTIIGANKVTW